MFLQYQQNLGRKCGICGDPYNGPKPHEAPGGKYANGIIGKPKFQFKISPQDGENQQIG